MADSQIKDLTALTTLADDDITNVVDDPSSTNQDKKITWSNIKANLKTDFISYHVISDLGTNGTSANASSARSLNIRAGLYNASTTLTFSSVTNLNDFTMQITNTNANVLTFAGITVYFKSDDLPSGVTFASNALTFPADTAVKYNIVGVKFDGSTFDCKIEIR